jgi:hypothetical protein
MREATRQSVAAELLILLKLLSTQSRWLLRASLAICEGLAAWTLILLELLLGCLPCP